MRKLQDELDELSYIHASFEISVTEGDIIKGKHDTVIYIYDTYRDTLQGFTLFCGQLHGKGLITHNMCKVEVNGLKFLFRTRKQILSGALRGYNKMSTLIISRGGI